MRSHHWMSTVAVVGLLVDLLPIRPPPVYAQDARSPLPSAGAPAVPTVPPSAAGPPLPTPPATMPGTADGAAPSHGFSRLEAVMGANNAVAGPRTVPGRVIPVPPTVSPQFRDQVAAPYRTPDWDANPKTAEDWRALVASLAEKGAAKLPALRDKLGVTSEPVTVAGVKAYVVQAKSIPDAHKDKLVLAIHGGGFVYNPGEAGTLEAILIAGFGGYKVLAVDYRMAPDHPFPAGLDDVVAVYKEVLKANRPGNVAVIGTSAGGNLALGLCLRAKAEGLPQPGAIAPGTPEVDMTDSGDTVKTNEWLDNALVSAEGYVANARKIYAPGHDLRDPLLSPIFGDFAGLPPMIITAGTRDLFLSNAVRTHRKARAAGIEATLQVFEGMSHAQYLFNVDAPETREAFTEIGGFFDKHLGK